MIDPAKISGSRTGLPPLQLSKKSGGTLGLLGYHRPWIPNFAKIAKPLTDLLQKGREFAWSRTLRESRPKTNWTSHFGTHHCTPPPDTDQQFILYVDASQFATGAILYQADKERRDARGNPLLRPLGFNSQTFNKTEQNYPIYDRELLGMMRGLRTWRHLLRNTTHPVLVITDHATYNTTENPRNWDLASMAIWQNWRNITSNWSTSPVPRSTSGRAVTKTRPDPRRRRRTNNCTTGPPVCIPPTPQKPRTRHKD